MSRAHALLLTMLAIACVVAVSVIGEWAAWAVIAAVGWLQLILLALRVAPSVLASSSVLRSTLLSVGTSSLAVAGLYRDALPQSAHGVLIGVGFALLAASLFIDRSGARSADQATG